MTVSTGASRIRFGEDFPHDKVTLAGNCGVGKTSLFLRFKFGRFVENTEAGTLQAQGEYKKQWQEDDLDFSITLFDTAGEDIQFKRDSRAKMNSVYFREAKVVLLVYDISDRATFDDLSKWDQKAPQYDSRGNEVLKALVGNKLDLGEDERAVTISRANEFARNKDIPQELVFEVSALTGENVEKMFKKIGESMKPSVYRKPTTESKCAC